MKLEHANVTVSSINKAIRFLKTAFPEFEVRGQGVGEKGKKWLHLGTDSTYIALEEVKDQPPVLPRQSYFHLGINHLCFEVENIDEIHRRLSAEGYLVRPVANEQFRKRLYADDNLGNEWEFVEYLSKIPGKKNLYE